MNQAEESGSINPLTDEVSLLDKCTRVMGDPSAKMSDIKKQMGMPNAVFVYCEVSPSNVTGGLIGLPRACVAAESVL